jgi:hypothetical protein
MTAPCMTGAVPFTFDRLTPMAWRCQIFALDLPVTPCGLGVTFSILTGWPSPCRRLARRWPQDKPEPPRWHVGTSRPPGASWGQPGPESGLGLGPAAGDQGTGGTGGGLTWRPNARNGSFGRHPDLAFLTRPSTLTTRRTQEPFRSPSFFRPPVDHSDEATTQQRKGSL